MKKNIFFLLLISVQAFSAMIPYKESEAFRYIQKKSGIIDCEKPKYVSGTRYYEGLYDPEYLDSATGTLGAWIEGRGKWVENCVLNDVPDGLETLPERTALRNFPEDIQVKLDRTLLLPANQNTINLFKVGSKYYCDLYYEQKTIRQEVRAGTWFKLRKGSLSKNDYDWYSESLHDSYCGEEVTMMLESEGGTALYLSCHDRWKCEFRIEDFYLKLFKFYAPKPVPVP